MNLKAEAQLASQVLISDADFNKALRDEMNEHHRYFNEGDEKRRGFIPQLHLISVKNTDPVGEKHHDLVAIPFFDEDKKFEIIREAGHQMALTLEKQTVVAVLMSTEAWVRKADKNDPSANDPKVSKYDDKKEAIVTAGMTMDARHNMSVQIINRNDDETITLTDESVIEYKPKGVKIVPNLLHEFYIGYTRGYSERIEKKYGKIPGAKKND